MATDVSGALTATAHFLHRPLFAPCYTSPPLASTNWPHPGSLAAAPAQPALPPLHCPAFPTQILAELPPEVRRELLASIDTNGAHGGGGGGNGGNCGGGRGRGPSTSAAGADADAAWAAGLNGRPSKLARQDTSAGGRGCGRGRGRGRAGRGGGGRGAAAAGTADIRRMLGAAPRAPRPD
eukprot:364415-Chlamydomonas_euryale.AAC.5